MTKCQGMSYTVMVNFYFGWSMCVCFILRWLLLLLLCDLFKVTSKRQCGDRSSDSIILWLCHDAWSGFLASRAGWPFMAQLRDKKKEVPSGRYSVWWSPLELSHLNDCTWGPCLCRKGLTQQAWGDQTLHIPRKDLSSRLALGWLLVDEQPWALRPHNPSCLDSLC